MLQSTQGVSSTQFRDSVVSLAGQNSIVGRALVVSNFTYHFLHNEENTNTNYIYIVLLMFNTTFNNISVIYVGVRVDLTIYLHLDLLFTQKCQFD
jgi:hypothetical protein